MAVFRIEWLLRILCSVAAGFAIGHERHRQSKSAGIRTHAIVSMASCLVMLVSEYAFADAVKNDPARIAAAVISGVGFLGAGIIFTQNGSTHGLTTAAGVWATSAIGMTFGGGMAMLPILQREVVTNRGWATDEELTDYYAIGQCTPGVIAVNVATFIGCKRKGIASAFLLQTLSCAARQGC